MLFPLVACLACILTLWESDITVQHSTCLLKRYAWVYGVLAVSA